MNDYIDTIIDKMESEGRFKKSKPKVEYDENGRPYVSPNIEKCEFEELEDSEQNELKDSFNALLDVIEEMVDKKIEERLGDE